jgi:trigger factor
MQVTTERLEDCQVNVLIELDAAEVDKRLRNTARQISRHYTVPGYRRGKAPFHAVIRVFGREAVQQQAMEDFGQELYDKALEEIEYEPYQMGELTDVEWDPFRMTVLLPIPPEIDLGDYRSVQVPFEVEPVTDEQIDEYLTELQREQAQWVPVDRPATLGDQVVLDMEGKAGDQEVMSNEDYEMLLEAETTHPLPGFHEEIVGMSPGEEKTFLLTLPEDDLDEQAAGQEATIVVRLHAVKEEDLPPMDDELAMMVGDYDTLDDLKTGVRERLETEALQRTESEYLDKALDAFIEAAVKVEYPPQAVDREADLALNQMESNLASSGIQLDTYLGMIGKTREMYKQELHPASEERLKRRLVLAEIARQEELDIAPEDVEAEIERMREILGPQAEETLQTLSSPGGRLMVADDLMTSKAQERAMQIAKGEAPPLEGKEEEATEVEIEEKVEAEGEEEGGIEAGVEETVEAEGEEEKGTGAEVEEKVEAKAEAEIKAEVESEAEAGTEEPAPEAPVEVQEQESVQEPDSEGSD